MPIADDWLNEGQLEEFRKHLREKYGNIELETISSIFDIVGEKI